MFRKPTRWSGVRLGPPVQFDSGTLQWVTQSPPCTHFRLPIEMDFFGNVGSVQYCNFTIGHRNRGVCAV